LTATLNPAWLESLWEELPAQLLEQRWFADKHRQIEAIQPHTLFWLRRELPAVLVALVVVRFQDGGSARYQLPLGIRDEPPSSPPSTGSLSAHLLAPADPDGGQAEIWVADALADPDLATLLLQSLLHSGTVAGVPSGELQARSLGEPLELEAATLPARTLALEQSNSLVVYGEGLLLKVFRRLWPGINPELQLLEALDEVGFTGIAKPWLAVEASLDGDTHSLGMLQTYLRNGTDGFTLALTSLRDLEADLLPDADGEVPSKERCDEAVWEQGGSFVGAARELGTLTARMHLALASPGLAPAIRARALTTSHLERVRERIEGHLDTLLASDDPRLEPLRVSRSGLREMLHKVEQARPAGLAIRIHGDLHLGQLLMTDDGWHVLDFEGRPAISVLERSEHTSPLQDVAGMLRSFDYAAAVALRQQAHPDEATARTLAPYGRSWATIMRAEFWAAYRQEPGIDRLIGTDATEQQALLTAYEVGQALYEVDYELRSRPDWLTIPLEGIARLVHGGDL
jgi:maltokinase